MSSFEFRGLCGCPRAFAGNVVHRIQCRARLGIPVVFPPSADDIASATNDIQENLNRIAFRAGYLAGVDHTPAEVDQFVEETTQRLHVIALARAVLASAHGKANPSND